MEDKYQEEIKSWYKEVYENSSTIDPFDEYDWHDLALGFFLGKGIPIQDVVKILLIVTY